MTAAASIDSESARSDSTVARSGRPVVGPLRWALTLGGVNLILSVAWILASSRLAAMVAADVDELARIERWKGLAFVVGMSAVVGLLTWLLLGRVERQQRLVDDQRAALVESEGRALAGLIACAVAHDMNNVLTIALGRVELARDAGMDDDAAGELGASLQRMAELAGRLQVIGRSALPGDHHALDLARAVRESLALVARHPQVARCKLVSEIPDRLPFQGSESLLARAVTNLVLNAGEATEGRGTIRVLLAVSSGEALLEVHDDGPGVPSSRRAEIFEPFHSTKDRGSGLGLVSVRAAAKEHGGEVEVGRSDLGGALLRMRLPLDGAASARSQGASEATDR